LKTAKKAIFFGRFAPKYHPIFWALRAQVFIVLKNLPNLWNPGFNDGGGVNSNWMVHTFTVCVKNIKILLSLKEARLGITIQKNLGVKLF